MLIRNDYRPRMTDGATRKKSHSEPGKFRVYLVIFALVALLPAILIGRSALFHINQSDKQMAVMHSTFIHNEKDLSMRGRILDRNHAVLAISEQMNDVVLDSYQLKDFAQLKQKYSSNPKMLMDVQEQEIRQKQKIEQMAQLLGLDTKETLALFDVRNYAPRGEKKPPEGKLRHGDKYLARNIDKNLGDELKTLKLDGLKITAVEQRRYPDGYLFGQLIGFSKTDYDPAVKRERIIGIEGLEHHFNTRLSGKDGLVRMVRDNRKNSIGYAPVPETAIDGENPYHPAVHGEDLVLTVDKNIQAAAMTALKNARKRHNADRASAVVLDAQSGEILAMANYPSFDPAEYRKHPSSSYRNNAVADSVEPGSVIKPFIVAKALEEGKVRPNTVLDTRPYFVGDKQIHDSDGRVYPQLSIAQIIQKSSNVGVVRLAMQWKAQDMHDYFYRIGMGRGSGADLPGENTVPLRPANTWKPVEQATMSYGYGVQGNLLQFARALTVFTNDGVLLPATLIKNDAPAQGERIFSEKTARQVRQMMHLVTEKGGTGTRAAINGYDVGGKSGTAEICFFGRDLKKCRYSKNHHRALFAGFAPVDNPRVIVVVSLENPKNREAGYSGGRVAAPVFGEITGSALNIMGVPPTRELHINTVAGLSE